MKRILCIILTFVMMVSLFPVSFAEEETAEAADLEMVEEEDWLPIGDQEVRTEENDSDYEPVSLEDAIDLTEGELPAGYYYSFEENPDDSAVWQDDVTATEIYEVTAQSSPGESVDAVSAASVDAVSSATVKSKYGTCGAQTYYSMYYYADGTVILRIYGTGAVTSAPWNINEITQVSIENGVTSLPDQAFYISNDINDTLKTVEMADSVTQIGSFCFASCRNMESVILSNNLKSIPDYAFYGCHGLKTITLPGSLTSIGEAAFQNCDFANITIPSGVTSIGIQAFDHCIYLEKVSVPASVKKLGAAVFQDCWGLKSVTIGSGITSLSPSLFFNCDSLTSVSIPTSVLSIEQSALGGCESLKALAIPSSVRTIGNLAFCFLNNDLTLTFRGDAPTISNNAFASSTIIANVPADNSTWTSSVMQNYGGTVTWNKVAAPYVTGVRKPTGTLSKGSAFTLKGVIYPGGGTFSKVGALVYLASDTSYTTSKTGKQITYNSTKKYSIEGSTLDTNCKFGSLAPGKYVYIITATVDGKKYILDKSSFTIGTPTYTITYDGNGATTNVPAKQTKTYDKNLTLSTKVPTWEDYEFLGWATSKTATEATYQPGGTYKANKDATLYAVWKRTGYTLCTYLNYSGKNYFPESDFTEDLEPYFWASRDTSVATISIDNDTRHDGYNSLRIDNVSAGMKEGKKDLLFRAMTPKKAADGYINEDKSMIMSFWAKSSTNGAKMYFRWGYEDVYRSVTLTTDWAKYTVRMDRVSTFSEGVHPYVDRAGTVWLAEIQLEDGTTATDFVPENGGFNVSLNAKVGSTYSLPAAPSRPGYTFLGWYTSARGGSQITSSTSVKSGNLYVYAHWSGPAYSRSFNVSFDADEGYCATTEKLVTYHGTYGELPVPYRTGYRFAGWYKITDEGDDLPITADTVMNTPGNHTLYAHWEKLNLLVLPSITSGIEEEAFAGCAAEYILIPENTTQIGTRAFADCAHLEVVEFCANSSEISEDAFENCVGLTIVAPTGGSIEAFASDHNLIFVEKQTETLLPDT